MDMRWQTKNTFAVSVRPRVISCQSLARAPCTPCVPIGRCPIVDTWWQTETGAHMITPLPGATPLKPGCATLPFFGVDCAVLDEHGNELQVGGWVGCGSWLDKGTGKGGVKTEGLLFRVDVQRVLDEHGNELQVDRL